jgi:GT2 family glycosyltransferase
MDETLPPQTPKVTAILIAHNQAGELRRAIEALERSEQREQLEILVVDCASQDETGALADEFPGIVMQRLPHHFGATKALNIATRTARGEFLLLLSPDVEVPPELVSRLAEHLEASNDTNAVCPLLIDSAGQPASKQLQSLPDRESLKRACAGGEIPGPRIEVSPDAMNDGIAIPYPSRAALMVRKQFVAGMNYFDERFGEYWADADLAMKIRQAGKKIRLYPAIRATWHAAHKPLSTDPVHTSDRILGAAMLLSKYDGFLAGFFFRWAATLNVLIHFDFPLLSALLGGRKLGSEAQKSYPT